METNFKVLPFPEWERKGFFKGSKLFIGKKIKIQFHKNMENVDLTDIEYVSRDELRSVRLLALVNSYDSFHVQLNNTSTPIIISRKKGKPYKIISGKHKIYMARQKGYETVSVIFV